MNNQNFLLQVVVARFIGPNWSYSLIVLNQKKQMN